MSPEQATAEKDLTGRSDVYSLASVLYEMLAGDPPHMGSSAQQIILRIITDEPRPLAEVRRSVPPNVGAAVSKGLEKLPADRFETARAFADALADPHFRGTGTRAAAVRGAGRPWWRDPRIAATGVAGIAVGALLVSLTRSGRGVVPVEYDVGLPGTAGMMSAAQDVGFALAPAGDFVVYETVRDGRSELWYRSLLDATARRIPGSDGGSQPVISPDGRRIAFFRLGDGEWTVEVLPVDGGTSTTLGRGVGIVRKLFWPTADGVLLLQSDGRVARRFDPERGGSTSLVMRYCESQAPIPGTDRVLCGGGGLKWGYQVVLGDSVLEERLWHAEDSTRVFGSSFQVLEGRYLTYVSIGADLLAAPVDLASGRVGGAVRMASGLGLADYTGNASYAIAASGTLVYAQGDNRSIGNLVRVRETGIDTLPVGRDAFVTFEYSPDARRLAAVVEGLEGMELRIYDLSSGRYQTWIRRPSVTHPAWSPQGDQLVFSTFDSLFVGAPDRSGVPEFLLHVPGGADAMRWMPDDRVIVLQYESMAILAMLLDRRPVAVDTLFFGNGFTWPSADGRWVAYTNSGWTEAWIEPLPADGRRFQVAAGNLADLQWLSAFELGVPITDGGRTRVERVTVDPSATPPARNRGWWADAPEFRDTNGPSFATVPGGGLMYLQGAAARPASYLRVVPHWVDRMKQAVDEANR
jgi:serine/threonine-protein kinase